MKKVSIFSFVTVLVVLGIMVLFTSCNVNSPDEKVVNDSTGLEVSVYSVYQESLNSPARKGSSESINIDKLVYIIMQNGEAYKTIRQVNTDLDFGKLSVNVPVGVYALYIYGSRNGSDVVVNVDGTINVVKSGEGFNYADEFSISRDKRTSINAKLTRCVAKINVDATDTKDDAVSVSFKVSGNASIYDLASNTGVVTNDYVVEDINMSNIANPFGLSSYILLPEEESTITMTFIFKYADSSTREVVFEDIPMRRNCATNLTGALFHEHGVDGTTITIDTTWGADISVER